MPGMKLLRVVVRRLKRHITTTLSLGVKRNRAVGAPLFEYFARFSTARPTGHFGGYQCVVLLAWRCSGCDIVEIVCHEATRKMRVGPSESACRSGLQTTLSCCGKEPWW